MKYEVEYDTESGIYKCILIFRNSSHELDNQWIEEEELHADMALIIEWARAWLTND